MKLKYLSELDYEGVVDQYNTRQEMCERLTSLLKRDKMQEYVDLAIGIEEIHGNYSARDHNLGPQILGDLPLPYSILPRRLPR